MDAVGIVLILAFSILPALAYMVWVRNQEKWQRESFCAVLTVFMFSAIFSLTLAAIIEDQLDSTFLSGPNISSNTELIALSIIIAPIVEECAKSLAVLFASKRLLEVEDGLVYGAAAGLGFAAVENISYNWTALTEGTHIFLVVSITRALSSTLLHASATAVTGYGISTSKLTGGRGERSWVVCLLGAILLHATFNAFAISSDLVGGGDALAVLGMAGVFTLSWSVFTWLRAKIRYLDSINVYPMR